MKKYFLLLVPCALFLVPCAFSQNVGIGTSNPQNKLHVAGGFRLDTLTGVGGNGLLWHDANGVVYGIKFTGIATDVLRGDGTFGSGGSGSVGWLLNGNSGTDPANNFIGTTDNQPLKFRIRSLQSGIIDSALRNTAFGYRAASSITTATENTALGFKALRTNATGFANTAIGSNALTLNTTGSLNIAIGSFSLQINSTGSANTAAGLSALSHNTTGATNSAFGEDAAYSNTTGYSNVAIGVQTLLYNQTSSNLVAVGDSSLFHNTDGRANTAVGSKALYSNSNGFYNTSLGFESLYLNATGGDNTALGYKALYHNTTSSNTAVGSLSLYSNTTGSNNTAIGYNSLWLNSAGYNNTAVGNYALNNNSTGQGNVAIGFEALNNNTTGDVNTAIGAQADVVFGNQINTTLIGHFAKASSSNKVRIGNAAVTVIEGQVAYTYPSDGRFKTNVSEDIKGLDFIMKLRPVSYNFQTKRYEAFMNGGVENAKAFSKLDFTESENLRHNGFVAQEVEKAAKDAGYNFDGVITPKNDRDTYGLSYSQFVVPLVKAVQEQQAIIKQQQQQINELLKRIEALEKK